MTDDRQLAPSFAPSRKWSLGFGRFVGILALLAIVVMVNYISQNFFFRRIFVGRQTQVKLSPQTLGLLKSITNHVNVILYYDREDPLYPTITALLDEYRLANPRISIKTVDYTREPGAAQQIKAKYKLNAPTDKNLVIFNCEGRYKIANGDGLMEYERERVPNERELEFRKRPVKFKGELTFSAMLLGVINPHPLLACYLIGNGEHLPGKEEDQTGYLKFITVAAQSYVKVQPVTLLGTNDIPDDAAMLIIAGPSDPIPQLVLDKIEQYLEHGGRLLALFNYTTVDKETGLEKLLARWGVNVTSHLVVDKDNTTGGQDIIIRRFGKHPVVNALMDSSIHMILPREIARNESGTAAADAPDVEEIASTGDGATLYGDTNTPPKSYPVAVAVEKGAVAGLGSAQGSTRIVVVGDSIFLGNQLIDLAANRDFESYALNWLLDRPQLLEGIGPRKVDSFQIVMTRTQLKTTYILLMAGLPGASLLLGILIWLRRRS